MANRLFYVGWHIPNLPPKLAKKVLTKFPPKKQIWPFRAKSGDLNLRIVRDIQGAKKLYHGPLDFGMKTSGTEGPFTEKGYTKASRTFRGKSKVYSYSLFISRSLYIYSNNHQFLPVLSPYKRV